MNSILQSFGRISWRLLLGGVATFPLIFSSPASAQNFDDIQDHWARSCINNLVEQGIVSGYPDNTFRPFRRVSRAEFAAMLNEAFPNADQDRQAKEFVDVPGNHWAYEAVQMAYRKGFLSGYPDDRFRPENSILHQNSYVALASGLDYDIPENPEQILKSTYQETEYIRSYAQENLASATVNDVVIAFPNPEAYLRVLEPDAPVYRGRMAAILCQAKEIPGVPDEYTVESSYTRSPLTNLTVTQTLPGHTGGTASLAISPDGQTIVSGGTGIIKIWDFQTGNLRQALTNHTDLVSGVDISSDSQRVASSSLDGTVKIWDLQTGVLLYDFTDYQGPVNDVAISPDNSIVASASSDNTVKVWDLNTGELLRNFGHSAAIDSIAVIPNSTTVASGGADGLVRIWDWSRPESEALVKSFTAHSAGINALESTPEGQTLVSSGVDPGASNQRLNTIKIWQLPSGELRRTLTSQPLLIESLSVGPGGQSLAVGSQDEVTNVGQKAGIITVWDIPSGKIKDSLLVEYAPRIDIGPDGKTLVQGELSSANEETPIQIWNTQ